MRARRLTTTLLVLSAGALAAPAVGQAAACPKPGRVTAKQTTLGSTKVSWRPSAALRRAKVSFRVLRGSTVVGQTTRTSMVVRARAGRRITVKVGVVGRGGRAPRCWSTRRVRMRSAPAPATRRPGTTTRPATGASQRPAATALTPPADVSVQPLDDRRVLVAWAPAPGAAGYRVVRDGATVGQTGGDSMTAAVIPGATHTFTVVAVDAAGRSSDPSAAVRFDAATRAPGAVADLTAPVVTTRSARVAWTAAHAGTAPVRGYRVTKDGRTVGQFAATQADVEGMAEDRQYELGVTAVDTRGIAGPTRTVTVRTQVPAPTRGSLHAFVLASTDASFATLQRAYDQVGVVYPTYFDCAVSGDVSEIKGKDDPLLTRWAKDRRITVMPRFNCQRPQTLRAIFTQPARRAALIDRLVALAAQHDYDGINLDFEAGAPQDRDALTAFVADLAAGLHRAGRKLTVDVSPKFKDVLNHPRSSFYDYKLLSEHADWIWVMGWGLHWRTSAPGPAAPATWLRQVYDYVAGLPRKSKYIMGLPLYGLDWPAGGGPANPATALTYPEVQQLVARHGAQVRRDADSGELTFTYTDDAGVRHDVWFADGASIVERLRIGQARGLGGVGVWRLGQEDPAFWTLLAAG